MHGCTLGHVAVIGIDKVTLDHLDGMQRKRVCIVAVCSRYVSFDRMGHSVHTCVCDEFLRHGFGKVRIYDRNVWCDFKISDRIFNPLLIIGNNRKCSYFGCGAGRRRNRTKMCFLAQAWDTEYFAHIFKGNIRIFVFDPHSLCSIDRRAAAHSDNPVRLKLCHRFRAFHYGLYRWVWLNAFKNLYFHSCFF